MYILYFYRSIVFYIIFLGILDNFNINVDNLLSCNAHLIIFTCILRNINIKLLLVLNWHELSIEKAHGLDGTSYL